MSNLKKIRNACGLSQSKLANASGVSVRMIQQYELYERDINKCQARTLYKLSLALDCKMEDLLEPEEKEGEVYEENN